MVEGLGFRVRVQGLGFRVWGLGFGFRCGEPCIVNPGAGGESFALGWGWGGGAAVPSFSD